MSTPVIAAESPRALIESLDHEGRGVAHVDGKAVFVEGALPRELVEYQASRKKKNFETAKLVSIVRESAERVKPKCVNYDICGGCALQHADYALQVAAKQRVLEDNLARIGKVTPDTILPPIYAAQWEYRHRARLSVHYVAKKGGVLVGFRERKSSYVADMHSCEVLAGGVGRMIEPLRVLMTGLDTRDKIPQIEVAVGERVTALVLRLLEPLTPADEIKLKAFADEHRIQWWVQVKGPETAVPWYPAIGPGGAAELTYLLPEFNLEILFRPTEFTQVNHDVNRLMVERAMRLLDPQPGEHIADLFCGLGNFSLPIARLGANVIGVEGSASLTERAEQNAARNGLGDKSRRSVYRSGSRHAARAQGRQDADRSAARWRCRSVQAAVPRTSPRTDAHRLCLLQSGHAGARCGHPGAHAGLPAEGGRCGQYVSPHGACGVDCLVRTLASLDF